MKKFIIIFLFFCSISVFAQISPGELSQSHSQFEGLSNCTKCHTLGEGLSNSKCLDCHNEIKIRIQNKTGYHANKEVLSKNCWECHSDHNGRNFKLINFNPKSFDHSKTGYELTGSHRNKNCSDCHNKKFINDPKLKNKHSTYLGLNTKCASCHNDVHQQTAGNNCENCHNTSSFKSEIKFDHSQTAFPLIGSHKSVNCINCHKPVELNDSRIIKFVSMKKINCTDCHTDIHKGKFGNNCLQCHNYSTFRLVTKKGFDHSKTGFPLIGKHQFVNCQACHHNKLTVPIKHDLCMDCHKDYHKGEFTKNNKIRDCRECHSEEGFTPSKFTIEQHQQLKFKLSGAHLAVECKNCHYKNSEWQFRFSSFTCVNCHLNVHKDEISKRFIVNNKCENCHKTSSWRVDNFDHNQTKFVLIGKHLRISCSDCHIKKTHSGKIHKFRSIKSDCLSCHEDYHYNQYNSDECSRCHTFESWKQTIFDHNEANFKLQGAHQKVDCIKCHPVQIKKDGGNFILFKTRRLKCIDCHLS